MRPIQYTILTLFLFFSFSLSAQKDSGRKETKRGNKAYKSEKYAQAAIDYQAAIEKNPNSNIANYNFGNTLYKQKKWDESIKQQQHYLILEKKDPEKIAAAWHNIGNSFLQKKDVQKAMEAYKMALRLNPNDDEARYNLAVTQKIIQDNQQNQNDKNKEKKEQDKEKNKDKEQQQNQQDKQDQQDKNKEKKPEQQQEPEQMSRENAKQILQAIEQDEKETQERVKQIKAQERKQQAADNRRQDKDW